SLTIAAPGSIRAVSGNQQVSISWDAVVGATSYMLYWSTIPFSNKSAANRITDVLSPYLHAPLTNGITYYYRVSSVANSQESGLSAQVAATPTGGSTLGYVEGYLLKPSGGQGGAPVVSCGAPAGYQPLTGATVALTGGGTTLTSASGYFQVAGTAGLHSLSLSASNYMPITQMVNLPSAGGIQPGTQGCLSMPKSDTTALSAAVPTVAATAATDIQFEAQVADSTGTQLLGMPASSFSISVGDSHGQNFQPATLMSFSQQTSGGANYQEFTAVLVLDASGSMLEPADPQNPIGPTKLDTARQAAQYFVDNKQPADAVALIIFDHQVTFFQDFTTDKNVLLQKLLCYDSGNAPCWAWGGSTAVYDAMYRGLEALETQTAARKFVIALTDGKDNASLHTSNDVILRANSNGSAIDTFGVGSDVDSGDLQFIASSTGGYYMQILDATQIPAAFSGILTQAQNPYSVTVSVPGLGSGLHMLKVDVGYAGIAGSALRLFTVP
ncbi:MAG: VWA domain-containing protein, partial [bacterium]